MLTPQTKISNSAAWSAHFLKWIDSSNLAVDKIIPVHGPVTTVEELRKAVGEMRNAQK